ncbi:rCG41748, isoform CRA_b [Rattus norvegicus]|uniref:RCG41748, isoform CRA_b n=1 Tax=Rattus norvegicus TaxID=10116 RepID=A6KU61_RAT|nr:rCG41748, isoform CRA_b [Rattus norvegicus]
MCHADSDEVCSWVVATTRDGKFVYGNQSCAECNATTVEQGSLIVSTNCCSASHFCNMVYR